MASTLFRAMRAGGGGQPVCGETAKDLGARIAPTPFADIDPDAHGVVRPRTGGMSVTPDDVMELPVHKLPKNLGGRGTDPVFMIAAAEIRGQLAYRDVSKPDHAHGFIEPSTAMPAPAYQAALCATGPQWRLWR